MAPVLHCFALISQIATFFFPYATLALLMCPTCEIGVPGVDLPSSPPTSEAVSLFFHQSVIFAQANILFWKLNITQWYYDFHCAPAGVALAVVEDDDDELDGSEQLRQSSKLVCKSRIIRYNVVKLCKCKLMAAEWEIEAEMFYFFVFVYLYFSFLISQSSQSAFNHKMSLYFGGFSGFAPFDSLKEWRMNLCCVQPSVKRGHFKVDNLSNWMRTHLLDSSPPNRTIGIDTNPLWPLHWHQWRYWQ